MRAVDEATGPHLVRRLAAHFYSTMLPNRNRGMSLKTNDRRTFYPTISRGVFPHDFRVSAIRPESPSRLPRAKPRGASLPWRTSRGARFQLKKGVNQNQVFCVATPRKQSLGTQKGCQEISMCVSAPFAPPFFISFSTAIFLRALLSCVEAPKISRSMKCLIDKGTFCQPSAVGWAFAFLGSCVYA